MSQKLPRNINIGFKLVNHWYFCHTKYQEIPALNLKWQIVGMLCYNEYQEIPALDLNWRIIGTLCHNEYQEIPALDFQWPIFGTRCHKYQEIPALVKN